MMPPDDQPVTPADITRGELDAIAAASGYPAVT